jgi:HD superfamily phosphodiesterase
MEQVDQQVKSLEQLAKQYYKEDGPNQWPHIQRVKKQAERLAKFRKKPLTTEELAAIYFHDIGKAESGGMDHGAWAAQIAKPLLKDYLTAEQIDKVIVAIKSHNLDKPSPSPEAELLRAADANTPNIAWFLRKSYYKMREKGFTHKEALENAKNGVKKRIVIAANLKYRPRLYEQAFATDIQEVEQQADKLQVQDVDKLIKEYNKTHPDESRYT